MEAFNEGLNVFANATEFANQITLLREITTHPNL